PGVLGAFRELDSTVTAIEELKKRRLGEVTVYTPTPRHEIEHAVNAGHSPVRLFTLFGGLTGATCGYWIATWVSDYWPLVVGGKPIASWVPYTIFGFEVMVLFGALSTVVGLFINSRIPRLTMTVGYDGRFSHGDYGVWVECAPGDAAAAESLLRDSGAVEVRSER
ncbi:MAG TPA: DUF3341 domain-containing protein, partial [Gemmatimonadaceae bacterium]|nr:DUF3341 domain-containing protein [Gemmatimonadaceae bacterium]